MKKEFNLKTDRYGFFKMYLYLISTAKPISELRKKEIDALAAIMERNADISNDFKDREDEKKWSIIFSYEGKQMMADRSSMPEPSFANALSTMRRLNIINDNKLNKILCIYPDELNTINFNFKLNG
jgi:hypothetical protein